VESAPPLLSGGVCHTSAAVTSLPLSKHTGGGGASLASLFIYSSVRECPSHTLWSSGHPALFAMCLFFFLFQLLVYYSVCFFLFFPWVGVSLSRGLC
jgi:hypothetical protein